MQTLLAVARNLFTHLGESSKLLSDNTDKPPFLLDKYSKTVGPVDNLVAQTPWKPEYVIPLSSRPKLWQLSFQMGKSAFDIEKNFRFHKGHGFGDKAAQATVEIKTKMSQTSIEIDSKSSQTLMVWSNENEDKNFDENQPGTSLNKRRSESKSTSTDVTKSESKFSQTKLNELASRDTQTSPRSSVSTSTQSSSQSVSHQSTSTQGNQPMRQETYHLEFHHHVEDEEVAAILERQHQLANQLMEVADEPVANHRAALRRSPRIMAQSSQRGNVSPARGRRFDPVNASPWRGRGASRSPERGTPSGIPTWRGKLLPDGAKRSQQKDNASRSPLLKSGQVTKRSQSTRGRGKSRESTGDQPGTSGSPQGQGRRRGQGRQSPGPTIAKQPRNNSPRERTSPYKLEKSDGRPLEVPGVTKEIAEQAQMQEYMLAARNSIEAAILEAIENTASLQAKEEIFELINQQQAGKRGQSSENVGQGHQKIGQGHCVAGTSSQEYDTEVGKWDGSVKKNELELKKTHSSENVGQHDENMDQGHCVAGTSSQEYDSEGKMWDSGTVKKTEPGLRTTHSLESSSSRGSQYVSSEEESARSDHKTRYDTGFFLYSSLSEGSNSFSTASSASTVVGESGQSQGQSEVNRDSPKLFRTSDWVIVNEIGKQLMERVPEKKDQEGPSARAGKFPPFQTAVVSTGSGEIPYENGATNGMLGESSKCQPIEIRDSNSSSDEEQIVKIVKKSMNVKREPQQIQSGTESEYELAPECSFIDFYKPELQQHRTSDELVHLTDSSTVLTMEDLMWVISLNKLAVQMETQPRFETRNVITSGIHVVNIRFAV